MKGMFVVLMAFVLMTVVGCSVALQGSLDTAGVKAGGDACLAERCLQGLRSR
jgi:hypothetical protein